MKPSTRKKRPIPAVLDQVRITRDGRDAVIEYADDKISDTRLTIGPQIEKMTDKEIVDIFNGVMAAQEKLLAGWDRTVTEIPPGLLTAAPMAKCRSTSTTRNCPWPSSASSSNSMPVGACASRSFPRNASQKILCRFCSVRRKHESDKSFEMPSAANVDC